MILITLLFLLADGAPASKALVECEGLQTMQAGDDQGRPGGSELIVDSRGAVIVGGQPATIQCIAQKSGQSWAGTIALDEGRSTIRIYLKEPK